MRNEGWGMNMAIILALFVMQSDVAEEQSVSCGVGAAYLLLERLGCSVPLEEIEAAAPMASDAPMSLSHLQKLFENLGFAAEGYRMPLERLDRPVIAFRPHPKGKVGHFVVVEPVGHQRTESRGQKSENRRQTSEVEEFMVLDPLDPPVRVSAIRLAKAWDGRVLVVHPQATSNSGRTLNWLGQNHWSFSLTIGMCMAVGVAVLGFLLRRQVSLGQPVLRPFTPNTQPTCLDLPSIRGSPPDRSSVFCASRDSRRMMVRATSGAVVILCAAIGYVVWHNASFWAGTISRDQPVTDADEIAPARIAISDWGTTILLENGTSFDFGQVQLGEKLRATFRVKNAGRQDLPLAKLKMNCACNAQVEYEHDVCRPGETADIQLSMTAVGYGRQRKPIPFAISRAGSTETLFTLNLNYQVAWLEQAQFVPSHLELGELSSAADQTERAVELVLIGPPDGPEPEVIELVSDSPAFSIEVIRHEPVPVNGRTARIIPAQRVVYASRLTIDPRQLPMGRFHGHIAAQTSTGEAKLHFTGDICGPIVTSPASLLVEKSRPTVTQYVIQLKRAGKRAEKGVGYLLPERPGGRFAQKVPDPLFRDDLVILSAFATTPGVSCVIKHKRNEVEVLVKPGVELARGAEIEILVQAGELRDTLCVPLVEF